MWVCPTSALLRGCRPSDPLWSAVRPRRWLTWSIVNCSRPSPQAFIDLLQPLPPLAPTCPGLYLVTALGSLRTLPTSGSLSLSVALLSHTGPPSPSSSGPLVTGYPAPPIPGSTPFDAQHYPRDTLDLFGLKQVGLTNMDPAGPNQEPKPWALRLTSLPNKLIQSVVI